MDELSEERVVLEELQAYGEVELVRRNVVLAPCLDREHVAFDENVVRGKHSVRYRVVD